MKAGSKRVSSTVRKKATTGKPRKLDARSSNYPVIVEAVGIEKKSHPVKKSKK